MSRAIFATAVSGLGCSRRGLRAAAALLALAGLSGWGTFAAAATLSPLVVAHDGQSVPAAGSGVTLAWLGDAVIDDAGRVIFRAGLEGAGVDSSYDYAILKSDGAGGLELVLREGEPAPGAAGAEFDEPKGSQPAGLEHIVVSSTLRGEGVNFYNDQGIWLWEDPGKLSLVARDGDPAPGTGTGAMFYNPRQFEANSSGRLVFQSTLVGPGVDSTNPDGIWFHDPTTGAELLARAGEPAPGTPAGTNFFRFSGSPEINDAGQIAFSARTAVGAYPGGIWSADGPGEPLTARFLTGDAAPGTPPGVTFSALFLSDMNSGGELAFVGYLSGSGITDDDDAGIWGPDGAGGVALIAREGSPALGVAGDARWGHATTTPFATFSLNDAGEVAFKGGLVGSDVTYANDWGLWGPDGSGGLTLIAREGDPVPDLLGVSFLTLQTLTPLLNAHGDVAFKATWLEETEEGQEAGWGLFVRTGEGAFLTVVRSGDLIEVEPGIFREVYEPRLAFTGLNDARQLTFRTNFIGGSTGIFLVTVPEVASVEIDIKPGNDTNPINPMSRGIVPVVILGSDTFDVADVDVTTLAFGPDAASIAHRNGPHAIDINSDGLTDLLAHFRAEETGVAADDTEACLTGETLDGTPFEGCDSVRTVPPQ